MMISIRRTISIHICISVATNVNIRTSINIGFSVIGYLKLERKKAPNNIDPNGYDREQGKLNIRRSQDKDIDLLPELESRAGALFRTIGMDNIANGEPTSAAAYREIHLNGLLWISADAEDRPAGFLAAKILDGCAYIHEISVNPDHQGKKIGKKLIDHFCAWAASRGYPCMTLSTFSNVPWNGPYYAKLGFTEIDGKDLGPEHRSVREAEIAGGLDGTLRIFMRRHP